MRNPEWLALSDAQRGHLVSIWLISAEKHGSIVAPNLPRYLKQVCGFDAEPDLSALETLGFISLDATMAPELRQPDANVTPIGIPLDAVLPGSDAPEESRLEEKRGEERRGDGLTGAPPAMFINFPVDGNKGAAWPLFHKQIAEWAHTYPTLDVEAECRKALVWVQADSKRRKTANGMPRFLVGWLNRSTNNGNTPAAPPRLANPHGYVPPEREWGWTEADQAAYDAAKAAEAKPSTL